MSHALRGESTLSISGTIFLPFFLVPFPPTRPCFFCRVLDFNVDFIIHLCRPKFIFKDGYRKRICRVARLLCLEIVLWLEEEVGNFLPKLEIDQIWNELDLYGFFLNLISR